MISYSTGVRLAIEIAGYEVANKNASLIEADHLMLGLLSLDKVADAPGIRAEIDFESFHYEKEKLYGALNARNISVAAFRRGLKSVLADGGGLPPDKIFHRSMDCKRLFVSAARLANNYLTINHLFVTILGWKTSSARDILIATNTDTNRLKEDLMFSFYMKN